MATITLKGSPIHTSGDLPAVGSAAPDFLLTGQDLADFSLDRFSGRKVVLNIFPSVDTPTCAMSVRRFNATVSDHPDAAVVCISRDLPFAMARFCGAEGLDAVETGSELRTLDFGTNYGVRIVDGPLAGLLARAVVVLDEQRNIIHAELVPEIAQEPDYSAALAVLT